MNRGLLSAVLAAIGGIIGYLILSRRMQPLAVATIRIKREAGGRFSSETAPALLPVKRKAGVRWNIVPRGILPEDASVVLRFDEPGAEESAEQMDGKDWRGSPLVVKEPADEREDGDRVIKSRARFAVHGTYPYRVCYESPGERYTMEDPEIQIEH